MKTRVVFACGLSELITSTLVLESEAGIEQTEDILLIYGRKISMPATHVKTILRLAGRFWRWKKVIDITKWSEQASLQLLDGKAPTTPDDTVANWLSKANEIYLHTIWNTFERFIVDQTPQASIILFDNGLDSHLPRELTAKICDPRKLAVRSQDLSRIIRYFYTLGDYLPLPDFVQRASVVVPTAVSLRRYYGRLVNNLQISSNKISSVYRPTALSIGTSFHRLKKFGISAEASVYREFQEEMTSKGYSNLWKSHPRESSSMFEQNQMLSVPLLQSIPLELLPNMVEIVFCGSISSTALLTLKKVYGIPYQLLGQHLVDKLSLPWMSWLQQHAEPEISRVLE